MALLAGLDLGTTSIKAILFDIASGKIVARASRPTPVSHPAAGWSEHDPEELWQSVSGCLREICVGQEDIRSLGIASMAEAGVPMDEHGQALDHAIAWFDRRSEVQTTRIEAEFTSNELFAISGQRVSPSFGLTKLLWIQEHKPEVFKRMQTWLPLPAYILYRLTAQQCVDHTIASRSLLFDQHSLAWSQPLCNFSGLSVSQLPEIVTGSYPAGFVTSSASRETGLPAGLICAPGSHDHLCAAFTAGAYQHGRIVDSTGTAQAVVQVVPHFLPDHRLAEQGFACYAHVLPDQYVIKAGLKAAGSAIDWLARLLSGPGREPDYAALEQAARISVGQRSGPLWLPHLLESGSPHSDRTSRAALVGAHITHNAGDLYRAMLESLAFWLRLNLEVMECFYPPAPEPVALIGGVTRIPLLSELKTHILNRPVCVPSLPEAAAAGAALLGGMASGLFQTPEQAISIIQYPLVELAPSQGLSAWYEKQYKSIYTQLYPALAEINHRFTD
jgi:xylulokinase